MAPKDLALRRSGQRFKIIANFSAYKLSGHSRNLKSSVPFNRWSSKLVGTSCIARDGTNDRAKGFYSILLQSGPVRSAVMYDDIIFIWIYSFSATYLLPLNVRVTVNLFIIASFNCY